LLLGLEIIIIFYLSFSGIGWWLLSVMTWRHDLKSHLDMKTWSDINPVLNEGGTDVFLLSTGRLVKEAVRRSSAGEGGGERRDSRWRDIKVWLVLPHRVGLKWDDVLSANQKSTFL
jgi:hypothetical protein